MNTLRSHLSIAGAIAALALATTGCWVFDEIDNAGKYGPKPAVEEPDPATADAEIDPAVRRMSEAKRKLEKYYNRSSSESAPADPDNPIVRCTMGGTVSFTRKYDCQVHGGRVG